MIALLAAALSAGGIATLAEASAWSVPYTWLPGARLARTAGAAAITALITGALTWGLLRAGLEDDPRVVPTSALVGFAFALLLALPATRIDRHFRGLSILSIYLSRPLDAERAERRMHSLLASARGARAQALLATYAASALTRHGRPGGARALLLTYPADKLPPGAKAMHALAIAGAALSLGDIEGADEALGSAPRGTDDDVDAWLRATEALGRAVVGGADAALEILTSPRLAGAPDDPALRDVVVAARAHALASKAEDEEAESLLRGHVESAGLGGLWRTLKPVGPATDLARALGMVHSTSPSEDARPEGSSAEPTEP